MPTVLVRVKSLVLLLDGAMSIMQFYEFEVGGSQWRSSLRRFEYVVCK